MVSSAVAVEASGLEIAVNDAVGVGVADRPANGHEDGQQPAAIGRWVGPVLEDGFEGAALDELPGQVRQSIGEGAALMHGGDAGCCNWPGIRASLRKR